VEKKVAVVRQMKEKLTPEQWDQVQARLRYAAHKNHGVDKFDTLWNPDLDYTGYFKSYRENMENAFKLEEEFAKETAGGRDPSDPDKYLPQRFWKNTQVYFDKK